MLIGNRDCAALRGVRSRKYADLGLILYACFGPRTDITSVFDVAS